MVTSTSSPPYTASVCVCVCTRKHTEETCIFFKFPHKVLNAGEMRRGCQVHYYPLGPNNMHPRGLTSLSKLRAGSVAGAVHLSSLHHPAEQYNLHHHRGAFISALCLVLLFLYYEPWPLTQGPNIVLLPTVIWHWVFLISCAPSLHPTFSLCLARVGARQGMSAKCKGLITFCWIN